MKKQVKKLSKKIMVLGLATSIIFTSCFSYKKINAHAASVAVGLSAYTLYEICLYVGGLAVSALGLGYAYENRDEIAEFGKSVIDSMSALPEQGWLFGSYASDSSYVYGSEALQEVQNSSWTVIQGGGNSPKNDDDNDGDGDKDADDRTLELDLTGYFLTQAGANFFNDTIKPLYDSWVNDEENSVLSEVYGSVNDVAFNGFKTDADGKYYGTVWVDSGAGTGVTTYNLKSDSPIVLYFYLRNSTQYRLTDYSNTKSGNIAITLIKTSYDSGKSYFYSDLPVVTSEAAKDLFLSDGILSGIANQAKFYRVADWIAEDEAWKGHLEDIATSLRSLQDISTIAQQLANNTLTTQPSADAYGDMMDNLGTEYAPLTTPINDPIYYPATNTTPTLSPSVLPNYVPSTNPDVGGDGTDTPDDGDSTEDVEIDLDGLLSLFNILFYLIMIIVMLIYLFLSCLAFIVMIFRIPSSSAMLPEDMVLGYEHLKTIMIPNMNISIYSFAMALIYMFIIFAVIKLLRHEINDFKFPRAR